MQSGETLPLTPMRNWIEVGRRPTEVDEWRAIRLATVRAVTSWVTGVVIGGLAGLVGVVAWPGALSWAFAPLAGLFLGIALPFGAAEFFFNRWAVTRSERVRTLDVQRIAIDSGKIYVEEASGRSFDAPIKRFYVSKNPVAADWHMVTLAAGRRSPSFYVPGPVATTIVAAKT